MIDIGFNHFLESLNKWPFSSLRIKDFRRIIELYPEEEMPFTISDSWSWRGIYSHPAFEISTKVSTKEHNLEEIDYVLDHQYEGWKGGTYMFDELDLVHFETDPGNSATGEDSYIIKFLEENADNEFVKFFKRTLDSGEYFNTDNEKIIFDGTLVKEGDHVLFIDNDEFNFGQVYDLEENRAVILDKNGIKRHVLYKKIVKQGRVIFKERI